jgi:hypothetical protein
MSCAGCPLYFKHRLSPEHYGIASAIHLKADSPNPTKIEQSKDFGESELPMLWLQAIIRS